MLLPLADAVPAKFATALTAALTEGEAREQRLDRAYGLVSGGGGAPAAARTILDLVDRYRAAPVA